jgi:hypothetical protein
MAHLLKSAEQDSSPFQFLLNEGVSIPGEVETNGFASFGIHTHFLGAVAFGASFLGCHAAFSSFGGVWMSFPSQGFPLSLEMPFLLL